MSTFVLMLVLGYFFHLIYKVLDKAVYFVFDAVRSKKNKARE